MRQKAIQQIKKRCSEKVRSGTPSLTRGTRPEAPFFFIYNENWQVWNQNRCQNLSKVSAQTCTETNHEHHQKLYFFDVLGHGRHSKQK